MRTPGVSTLSRDLVQHLQQQLIMATRHIATSTSPAAPPTPARTAVSSSVVVIGMVGEDVVGEDVVGEGVVGEGVVGGAVGVISAQRRSGQR